VIIRGDRGKTIPKNVGKLGEIVGKLSEARPFVCGQSLSLQNDVRHSLVILTAWQEENECAEEGVGRTRPGKRRDKGDLGRTVSQIL
jgi:hypothetical protein